MDQASEARVRGVIVGGVNAGMCPFLESLPFPVLVTEGFGSLPMSQQVFDLLNAGMGREVILSANTEIRWGARRPELLIPLRADEEMPQEDTSIPPLKVGDQVRALRAPYLGAVGTVAKLVAQPQVVESGARLPVAIVALETEEQALIPLANLELIY
jgi:hypothetical protein